MPLPEEPILFLKPTSAILDPDGHIVYPASSSARWTTKASWR